MQDYIDQAKKNGLIIKSEGVCQLCGAETRKGLNECVEIASNITHKLNHELGIHHMTIFQCVDAHALQHCEIHGRWNNHFHLTRLYLILKEGIKWNYKYSPLLSEVVDKYKTAHMEEIISPPSALSRGKITVMDVENATTDEEYIILTKQWAKEVFEKFSIGHIIASGVAADFLNRINKQR
jgi:hypothetical protein